MTHAAFLVTEAINEARDQNLPLFAATLDVEKAFDVVNHPILLHKLFHQGLKGRLWNLKANMYQNMTSKVKWDGKTSKEFKIEQGTRQGGLCSTDDYITYLHEGICKLVESPIGFHIGTTCIAAPTCADDIIIMTTDQVKLQTLLSIITEYANNLHYTIHPEKSHVIPFNLQSNHQLKALQEIQPWTINSDKTPVCSSSTHLGIQRRSTSADDTVDARLCTARKTLYALMGAGLHGLNGLPVSTSLHIYKIYVLPRLLYGLETITLRKPKLVALTSFHRSCLRNFTGLPDRTAIPALHIISGSPTLEALLHIKLLTFLHSILTSPGPAKDIVYRQYAIKTGNSHSWIIKMIDLLQTYNLPTLATITKEHSKKEDWKATVKKAVHQKLVEELAKEAETKSTLKFLSTSLQINTAHPSLHNITNARDVTRAAIKLRILTGTYTLQTHLFKFKKSSTDLCPLCKKEPEDTAHFLITCPTLEPNRTIYHNAIQATIPSVYLHRPLLFNNRHLYTQLLLDPSHASLTSLIDLEHHTRSTIEEISRKMIYNLHIKRSTLLSINL